MDAFPFRLIGFDLDGTLVDSNGDLACAINHALFIAGREPVPQESTRKLIGGGSRMMLQRALELTGGPVDEAIFGKLYAALLEFYEANIAIHTRPYPGCLAALDSLAKDHGCTLAVITNKPEHLALKLLEQLGMIGRFGCVIGGDTLGPGRAKPGPDTILEAIRRCDGERDFAMIGDSSFDVRAARAAGVPSVVLSFGYNDSPPRELGADAVIDHFDELVPTLSTIRNPAA